MLNTARSIIVYTFALFFSANLQAGNTEVLLVSSFKSNSSWELVKSAVAVKGKTELLVGKGADASIIYNKKDWRKSEPLVTNDWFGDSWVKFEFLLPEKSRSQILLQGRYAINLADMQGQKQLTSEGLGGIESNGNASNNETAFEGVAPLVNATLSPGEWQSMEIKFRAPRFDAARNKTEAALFLEIKVNDKVVQKNALAAGISRSSKISWEDEYGPLIIRGDQGPIAIRHFDTRRADFGAVNIPSSNGQSTNVEELVDFVAAGNEAFHAFGCEACHATEKKDPGVKSGPNLFGLFKATPRDRDIIEGGEGHRFTIKVDRSYLLKSVRDPAAQQAVVEDGLKKGESYLPIMPPYSAQVISDKQIDAIGAYLMTLNELHDQGPVIKLVTKEGPVQYDPHLDDLQLLVSKRTRIQRGPMEGLSGRAIHVGQTNGINYSFDPRILAIAKIWQGGFLDMSGEFMNRGGNGLKSGFESRQLDFGEHKALLAPLSSKGAPVDFSFKEAIFNDTETVKESLNSKVDHLQRVAAVDAQFLGYELDSKAPQGAPLFRYRVGENTVKLQTKIGANGETTIKVSGSFKTPQVFVVNTQMLGNATVSKGELKAGQNGQSIWTIPAGEDLSYSLKAQIIVASSSWKPKPSNFAYAKQKLQIIPAAPELPAGYRAESYLPPRDNYGREQLFEALGLAVAEDGTIVVATRTAGIWRIVKGEWQLFAEGIFDSLGVVVEDKSGLQVVVGQKAELTRVSDNNGDGRADKFETLFDAHSYHGNYHAYMHGPAKGADGAFYINLNLSHSDVAIYKAGGQYMGSSGGLSGWAIRVAPNGEYTLWANGLRSPAGIATAPDGRLWYSDNQGEFFATSKVFVLKQSGFYGHPAGLVDLPGMTPDSKEISWEKVSSKREKPVVLLPQNRVANSPGNPSWDTTKGRFGPFAKQMFIGDQTQSNLLRVVTEVVNGNEQGAVMPFATGLESGVMRPIFLTDGSLLLGQTGRGWQAKGGHVASLQRIVWDGKTVAPAISEVFAQPDGFRVNFTQPVSPTTDEELLRSLSISSWVYRDAPDYGSEIMDEHAEPVHSVELSNDRKSLRIKLDSIEQKLIHPQQTARVYHLALAGDRLFGAKAAFPLDAYYTLYQFPEVLAEP